MRIRAVPNTGFLIFGRIRIVGPTIRPNTNTNSCNGHGRALMHDTELLPYADLQYVCYCTDTALVARV